MQPTRSDWEGFEEYVHEIERRDYRFEFSGWRDVDDVSPLPGSQKLATEIGWTEFLAFVVFAAVATLGWLAFLVEVFLACVHAVFH